MNREGLLSIRDLMNFNYCKRIVYFENVLRIPQATTVKEFKGRALHHAFTQRSKRTKIVRELPKLPKKYNVEMKSKELNFKTVLDCLIINKELNEAYPVEYKDAKKPEKLYKTLKIQVFAESLLVKEIFGYSVPFAFIKFEQTEDLVKINIMENDMELVKQNIREIDGMVRGEVIPQPTEFIKKCKDCCFLKICRRM